MAKVITKEEFLRLTMINYINKMASSASDEACDCPICTGQYDDDDEDESVNDETEACNCDLCREDQESDDAEDADDACDCEWCREEVTKDEKLNVDLELMDELFREGYYDEWKDFVYDILNEDDTIASWKIVDAVCDYFGKVVSVASIAAIKANLTRSR
jgi:hypothetical protein